MLLGLLCSRGAGRRPLHGSRKTSSKFTSLQSHFFPAFLTISEILGFGDIEPDSLKKKGRQFAHLGENGENVFFKADGCFGGDHLENCRFKKVDAGVDYADAAIAAVFEKVGDSISLEKNLSVFLFGYSGFHGYCRHCLFVFMKADEIFDIQGCQDISVDNEKGLSKEWRGLFDGSGGAQA